MIRNYNAKPARIARKSAKPAVVWIVISLTPWILIATTVRNRQWDVGIRVVMEVPAVVIQQGIVGEIT